MKTKSRIQIIIGLIFFFFYSCNCHDKGKPPCPDLADPGLLPEIIYWQPSWHPSGDFISFNYRPLTKIEYPMQDTCVAEYTFNDDSAGYWAVNPDGSNKRRIFKKYIESVDWSPDGQWIAYNNGGNIYKMRFTGETFDTTTLYRLTNNSNNFHPSWSPDGYKLAYDSNKDSPNGMYFIWTMNSDGSFKKRIAYAPELGEIRGPSWSTNNWIAHYRYIGIGSSEIFVMDTSGFSVQRLTFNENMDIKPIFSFNNEKIAHFSQKNTSYDFNIWLYDLDDSTDQRLTTENVDDYGFSWSPDDQNIVYSYYSIKDWTLRNSTLWVVNVQSGVKRQLTFNVIN